MGTAPPCCRNSFYSDPAVYGFFRERGLQEWLDCYHSVNVDLWDSWHRGAIGRDYLRSERFARPLRTCGCGEEEAAARLRQGSMPTILTGLAAVRDLSPALMSCCRHCRGLATGWGC